MVLFPPVVRGPDALPVLPTPENVLYHSMRTGCNVMVTVPTFMSVWASEPTAVTALRNMELVIFSGGGLSEKLGDALVQSGIVLRNIYGGTEFGSPGYSSRRPGDEIEWEYFEFSKDSEVVWVDQGGETYECQLFVCFFFFYANCIELT
ncbi:hypothetical protein HYPSUDRAFT_130677 [Hypholoma sublateritium FD-334 SS-4]|uniref:AMP-dependent synthetase/ligase domain-containing protein n=1 Tax=Hypholoma sublateritium (strain FD-334 SS-4) TaxID=945553 RepID=A0A0D2Q745_HYPSF|nr:hypothetical protein HYPSUDRAFT_130677 [Hypholoma sublateritium FD-334 SS-4]